MALIVVDRSSGVPLHRQVASKMREAILSGRLAAGERIVSSRELQSELGVSRNTIVDALGQLHAEGYLVTVRGVGTFVSNDVARTQTNGRASRAFTPTPDAQRYLDVGELARNGNVTRAFRPCVPAIDAFPFAEFKRSMMRAASDAALFDYPDAQGHAQLRTEIARRVAQTRGADCTPDQVFITNGAQAAFSLIADALLKRGDAVVMEDPGYPNVRAAFLARGFRVASVAVDEQGIDVDAFARRTAKLAYVTPSHQLPTGVVLSLERRLKLLDWADTQDAWIVEDDYDSEFHYTSRALPSLYALSERQRVVYVGTFSKVLSPALRVGYVIVPPILRDVFAACHTVMGGVPSPLLQAALADFMDRGHFARHIRKMRTLYDERRVYVQGLLQKTGLFSIADSGTGLHFVADLLAHVSDQVLSAEAQKAGLMVPALSSFYFERPPRNGLIVGYAATPPAQARNAIGILAAVTRKLAAL
ncbi:MAG: PLP-dependent aminotransferase family protein [Candidatus Eremiobacteraeota bacterium]|nr:PLP-dependent aminotransferase family protein [Candidatus Eremiobacteraeota bacterium]